jgi:hypothetical protein
MPIFQKTGEDVVEPVHLLSAWFEKGEGTKVAEISNIFG